MQKIRTTINNVTMSDNLLGQGVKFKTKESAKQFLITSAMLYSDKISAILRELSCNAHDSHIAKARIMNSTTDVSVLQYLAPENTPFSISMPNSICSDFKLRDFGIGMSPESIMEIYTVYFASTKEDSLDDVGALGLGAKSPFSYTSTFNIDSYYNGKKYSYIAYMDNQGIPNIVHVGTVDVDFTQLENKNGLEISFFVEESDISKFSSSAEGVLFAFHKDAYVITGAKPNIKYYQDFAFDKGVYVFNSRHYKNCASAVYAKQGPVIYPVRIEKLGKQLHGMQVTDLVKILTDGEYYSSILMEFDIGQLDFSASREELSYDDVTVRTLNAKLLMAYRHRLNELRAAIRGKSGYELMCALYDSPRKLLSSKYIKREESTLKPYMQAGTKFDKTQYILRRGRKHWKDNSISLNTRDVYKTGITIYYMDSKMPILEFTKEMGKDVYYVTSAKRNSVVDRAELHASILANSNGFTNFELIPFSSVVDYSPATDASNDTQMLVKTRLSFSRYSTRREVDSWYLSLTDTNVTYYYTPSIETLLSNNSEIPASSLDDYLANFCLSQNINRAYVLNVKNTQRIKDNASFVDVSAMLYEQIRNVPAKSAAMINEVYSSKYSQSLLRALVKCKDSAISAAANNMLKHYKHMPVVSEYRSAFRKYDASTLSEKEKGILATLAISNLTDAYPLLAMSELRSATEEVISNYIKLVDQCNLQSSLPRN